MTIKNSTEAFMLKNVTKALFFLFLAAAGIMCEKDADYESASDVVASGTVQITVNGMPYSFNQSQLSSGWNIVSGSYSAEYTASGGYPAIDVSAGNSVMAVTLMTSAADSATYLFYSVENAYSISGGAVQSILWRGENSPVIGSGSLENARLSAVIYYK